MTRIALSTSQNGTVTQEYPAISTAEQTLGDESFLSPLTIGSQLAPGGRTLNSGSPSSRSTEAQLDRWSTHIKDNEMPVDGTPPSFTEGPVGNDHNSVLTSGSRYGEGDSNAFHNEGEDAPVRRGQGSHPMQKKLLSESEHRASDVDVHRMKIRNVGNKGNSINFVANDFQLEPSARVGVTGDVENVGNGGNSVNYVGNTDGPEGLEAFLKLVALVQGNPMQ